MGSRVERYNTVSATQPLTLDDSYRPHSTPLEVWSYAHIDFDLLQAETESVFEFLPSRCWRTKDEAVFAAERHFIDDWDPENGDPPPLKWEEHNNPLGDELKFGENAWVVFSMKLG